MMSRAEECHLFFALLFLSFLVECMARFYVRRVENCILSARNMVPRVAFPLSNREK